MYEFETFVYLDVHKTGSTFICTALKKFSIEAPIRKKKHKGVGRNYDKSKVYFISVRDPLDQYLSLYYYGCQGAGLLSGRLRDYGLSKLYDGSSSGFASWLEFMLDAKNAPVVHPTYGACGDGRLSRLLGLQSYRVLSLALPGAYKALSACKSEDEITKEYKTNNVAMFVVRTESLRTDLANLFRTTLKDKVSDLPKALGFINDEEPINSSDNTSRGGKSRQELDPGMKQLIMKREWFMYQEFGY